MRTLGEIISAAKIGEPVTHEEALYALLAYDILSTFDHMAVRKMVRDCVEEAVHVHKDLFQRWKRALVLPPKTYLGPRNDPANPDVVRRVKISRKIVDKLYDGEL